MRFKIKSKILFGTTIVVSLSLLLSSIISFNYAKEILREQTIKDRHTSMSQSSFQINKIQEQISKSVEYIISDDEIIHNIYERSVGDLEESYYQELLIKEKLQRFAALNSYILNVLIVGPDGQTYSNHSGYEDYFEEYLQQSWFTELQHNNISYSQPHSFFYINGEKQVFSYVVKFIPLGSQLSTSSVKAESYVIIDVSYTEIARIFEHHTNDYEQFDLYIDHSFALYSNGNEVTFTDNRIYKDIVSSSMNSDYYEDHNWIILSNDDMKHGWKQVAVISKVKMFEKINKMFTYNLIIVVCAILFTIAITFPIINSITKPIANLVKAMKRVSLGDLRTKVEIKSNDELELLGNGFNRMIDGLVLSMEESIQHEKKERQMQMDLLMSQINPHFIYNTLNTVIYLAHAKRNEQVTEVTQALITILQDTIRTGEGATLATVKQEKNIIERYFTIQTTRYPNRLTLEWDIEPSLYEHKIPRVMLQPLVENAIVHGIIPSEKPSGKIMIRIYPKDNQLYLEVEDTGIGLPLHEDFEIRCVSFPEHTRGIGLSNIKERLYSHYGASAKLELLTGIERGALIRIIIPEN